MKIQLESINANRGNSFSMMYNPRLSDLFFWHFHPEYELVYIKADQGTRHVGDHISTFFGSDLVLIGSNIPHLNFDYGIKTPYQKVVVHLDKAFVENHLMGIPELGHHIGLFHDASFGVAFSGELKEEIGQKLLAFETLNTFDQYQGLMEIFYKLAHSSYTERLHDQPYSHKFSERDQGRLRGIYSYIDQHYHQKIELSEIASQSSMTREAFCRYFKKSTGSTFVGFLNRYRISHAKRILMSGRSVSEACFETGFESLSYFNRIFKKISGENPSVFRKKYF
ncbi:MAG: AraC family transcriptional regulator [Bacteroidota bacterium]